MEATANALATDAKDSRQHDGVPSDGNDAASVIENMMNGIMQRLDKMEANALLTTKEVLTSDEAATYMGITKSYLYKLTMRREIPHSKPRGKMCYYNRKELEEWLQRNRVATDEELEAQARQYVAKHPIPLRKGGQR